MSLCDKMLVAAHAAAAVKETKEGDVIECGVYDGETSLAIREATKGRFQFAADTFTGMPDLGTEIEKKGGFVKGYLASPKGTIERLEKAGIRPVVGLLPESLPLTPYCFSWLDIDLEIPTRKTLILLMGLTVIGGRIGLHDYEIKEGYCLAGIERVVRENILNNPNWTMIGPTRYKHIFFKRLK